MTGKGASLGQRHDRRGLVWQMAGGYLSALCYGSPRKVLFSALLEWARSSGTRPAGIVVEDRRYGLGPVRLKGLRRLSQELQAPIVLLTRSPFARAAVALARLRGAELHAFGLEETEPALDQLGVAEADRSNVLAAIRALRVARALGKSRHRRSTDSSQTPVRTG